MAKVLAPCPSCGLDVIQGAGRHPCAYCGAELEPVDVGIDEAASGQLSLTVPGALRPLPGLAPELDHADEER